MEYLQNFYYKVLGNLQSDEYIVFLHGLMGSGINWTRVAKKFQDDFQVLVYDQRGHGRSFQPKAGYHPNNYAEDLYKILAELGWEKVHLVGHSMGGRNALSFAGKYPEKLKSLTIEDISPSIKLSAIDSMRSLINSVPVPFQSKQEAQVFFNGPFLERFSDREEGQVIAQFFNMNIVSTRSGTADWRFYKPGVLETLELGRREDAWPIVKQLDIPTLFLYGELSKELSDEDISLLKSNKSILTRCINGAGHWIHFDQAEAFIDVLFEFIEGHKSVDTL